MTEVSVWAYPWDLHDIGVDAALERMTAVGANMVSLATSYHAGRFLQPGNPRRKVYFPQDGTVYYQVDPDRWQGAEIAPLEADIVDAEGDHLAELTRRRDAGQAPGVSCWTVCCHNTRLGMAHPDHVMRSAHGDPHLYGLCPSSPAVRAYVTGMVAEVTERYRPDRVELESPDFMGFDHGFHHEKDGLSLLPEDMFLLGVCFCDHCRSGSLAAGVPVEAARDRVRALLDAAFARALPEAQFPVFPAAGLSAFDDEPDLAAYLGWRSTPVTSLIAEIKAAAHPDSRILLIDGEGSWQGGIHLSDAAAACDGILHCAYFTVPDHIAPALAEARAALGRHKTLIAGFQLFHPEVRDAADLAARTREALREADGLNYYNLGLVPAARLDWIAAALAS